MADEELDELARQLREGAGHELRAEAAEDETLTEIQRRRHRNLADVARIAMHRGDRILVSFGGTTLAHPVTAVGNDYLTMETDDGAVDVRLAAVVMSVESRSSGGHSGVPASATFRARLAEHEQSGAEVEVVSVDGTRSAGTIEVAATDHIVVVGTERAYVPVAGVALVFSRRFPRGS